GEVAVVLGLLLGPAGGRSAVVLVEVPGLLDDAAARVEDPCLALDLGPDGSLDGTQGVDVLGLATRAPRGSGEVERHVDVAAQRALLHPYIGGSEGTDEVAK